MATKPTQSKSAKAVKVLRAAYRKSKLAAQRKLHAGQRVTYNGNVRKFQGKPGVVEKLESQGGVIIRFGDKRLLCSPFAVLKKATATVTPIRRAAA